MQYQNTSDEDWNVETLGRACKFDGILYSCKGWLSYYEWYRGVIEANKALALFLVDDEIRQIVNNNKDIIVKVKYQGFLFQKKIIMMS